MADNNYIVLGSGVDSCCRGCRNKRRRRYRSCSVRDWMLCSRSIATYTALCRDGRSMRRLETDKNNHHHYFMNFRLRIRSVRAVDKAEFDRFDFVASDEVESVKFGFVGNTH